MPLELTSRNDDDPAFTVGPPASDAAFRILEIVLHYNATANDQQSDALSAGNGTASGGQIGAEMTPHGSAWRSQFAAQLHCRICCFDGID